MTVVPALLALGLLVVVPAALPLHPAMPPRGVPAAVAAAVPAAVALLVGRGSTATMLVIPWLVASAAFAALAVRSWVRAPGWASLPWLAAGVYLLVGAAWLAFDRADAEVAGFGQPLVQLTAVHFHYAGFATAVLVGCLWRHRPADSWAGAAALTTIAAPPLVAAGFTWFGPLQIAGAVMLTVGVWMAAVVTLRGVVRDVRAPASWLLGLSAVSVFVPMVLAVQWALGTNLGTPALSIPDMARTHGVLNAVGFSLAGVVGWRLAAGVRTRGGTAGPVARPRRGRRSTRTARRRGRRPTSAGSGPPRPAGGHRRPR